MKKIIFRFLKCGVLGWCVEILFTSIHSLKNKNYKLTGQTSIWMFPIYGSICILCPFYHALKKLHWFFRGLIYTITIFTGEYYTGKWLKSKKMCPWDYSKSKWNIKSLIRLDYAPLWFLLGLLYERLLFCKDSS